MQQVIFQKHPLLERLLGHLQFKSVVLLAAVIGVVLANVLLYGGWTQAILIAMVPFLVYAMMTNTTAVFLVWVASAPILNHFIRINLGAGIPDITINRVAVSALMLVLLFQIAVKVRQLQKMQVIDWLMVGTILIALPAIFRGSDPIKAGQVVFDHLMTPFIVFFLTKNLITTKEGIRSLVWTFGIVTVYCALLGFQEHFTEHSFFTATGELNWKQEGMADRVQGPFDTPQVLGSVMVGGIVFFFYHLFNAKNLRMRLFSACILFIHTMVAYWTYRRSVWMGYAVTMVFLGIVEKRFRRPLLAMFVLILLISATQWHSITQTTVYQERFADSRTVNDRWVVWTTSWEMIKDYPLLGTGLDMFGTYYTKYFTFHGNTVSTEYAHGITSAHNSYIRLWVEGGPMLALLYLGILLLFILRMWKLLSNRVHGHIAGKMEVMVCVGIFLTQYVQALTTDMVFNAQYSAILIFLLGGVLFQRTPEEKRTRSLRTLPAANSANTLPP
ncbi:MAG: O-antigen ligase family protein [Candidatus Krumholzibacteriota bacterium]|nr:O-antigen ligase family protein [Candidatus Krumholzibacteriota bacterium]